MRRTLENRLAKLEQLKPSELRPKKRAVPEWLQEVYEADGLIFDSAGQVIAARVNDFETLRDGV